MIHLSVKTTYSMLNSTISIKQLISKCVEQGMNAVGVIEDECLYSAFEFAIEAKKHNIKPIIGLNVNIKSLSTNVQLIAKNDQGFMHISQLSTLIQQDANDITLESLYNENVYCIMRSPDSANELQEIFKQNLYIGLEDLSQISMLEASIKYQIHVVAIYDIRFIMAEDTGAHDVLLCIKNNHKIYDDERPKSDQNAYFKTAQEMEAIFEKLPQAIRNTRKISDMCENYIQEQECEIPNYHQNAHEELEQRVMQALNEKNVSEEYFARAKYELEVINKSNFAGYFLIVADFIKNAKTHKIPVGPGRGSCAGSLVAWSLGITEVDSIKWKLLFERFLNPSRISMPDMDIDFCQQRRDEVIQQVIDKYGNEYVAHIITFGKLNARGMIRDIGRVIGMPYTTTNNLCLQIPQSALHSPDIDEIIEKKILDIEDEKVAKLLEIAKKLEGVYRNRSIHAAGVVIGAKKIQHFSPIIIDNGRQITQYSMHMMKKSGLIKFDFLGLKTLTVIQEVEQAILKHSNIKIEYSDDYDDESTYKLLASGLTSGVFQLESYNMKKVMQRMRPQNLIEIATLISLYRPGPMENIDIYINNKFHETKNLDLDTSILNKILPIIKETHGVIVYQEQVMEIAQVIAGFSLSKADILRKAMGEKRKDDMDKLRHDFISGGVINGYKEKHVVALYNLVAKFAGYGFNKSHATSYAIISYRTAFLKANYPIEFIAKSLDYEINNDEKIQTIYTEMLALNIELLPPCVNKSKSTFTREGNSIRFGINGIKGLGSDIALSIERMQPFNNLKEFILKSYDLNINKAKMEKLCYSGCFSIFSTNKKQIMEEIEFYLSTSSKNQHSLWEYQPKELQDYPQYLLCQKEYEMLSLCIKYKNALIDDCTIIGILVTQIPQNNGSILNIHNGFTTYRVRCAKRIDLKLKKLHVLKIQVNKNTDTIKLINITQIESDSSYTQDIIDDSVTIQINTIKDAIEAKKLKHKYKNRVVKFNITNNSNIGNYDKIKMTAYYDKDQA